MVSNSCYIWIYISADYPDDLEMHVILDSYKSIKDVMNDLRLIITFIFTVHQHLLVGSIWLKFGFG
jgi:hypothetical protein